MKRVGAKWCGMIGAVALAVGCGPNAGEGIDRGEAPAGGDLRIASTIDAENGRFGASRLHHAEDAARPLEILAHRYAELDIDEVRAARPALIKRVSLAQTGGHVAQSTPAVFTAPSTETVIDGGEAALTTPLEDIQVRFINGSITPALCGTLDFDTDAEGAPILAGQDLSSVYSDWGVLISASSPTNTAIAFDSSNPTGGDGDLATPGNGAGNDAALGNLLIIAEDTVDANNDGYVDDPDDEGSGGVVHFDFGDDLCVYGADVVDIEVSEKASRVDLTERNGSLLNQVTTSGLGNNSAERLDLDTCGVGRMSTLLISSGAVDNVYACVGNDVATNFSLQADFEQALDVVFSAEVKGHHVSGVDVVLANQSFVLDPFLALFGGPLPDVDLGVSSVLGGDYDSVTVRIHGVSVNFLDGSNSGDLGVEFSSGAIAHDFNVGCGTTDLNIDWALRSRFALNLLSLDIGIDLSNPSSSQGCAP